MDNEANVMQLRKFRTVETLEGRSFIFVYLSFPENHRISRFFSFISFCCRSRVTKETMEKRRKK